MQHASFSSFFPFAIHDFAYSGEKIYPHGSIVCCSYTPLLFLFSFPRFRLLDIFLFWYHVWVSCSSLPPLRSVHIPLSHLAFYCRHMFLHFSLGHRIVLKGLLGGFHSRKGYSFESNNTRKKVLIHLADRATFN